MLQLMIILSSPGAILRLLVLLMGILMPLPSIFAQQYNYLAANTRCSIPSKNFQEEWIPLTRDLLIGLGAPIWTKLESQGHTGSALASLFWAEMGIIFEEAVLQSLGISANTEAFNHTVPDAVGRIINGKVWQGWPKAVFVEVKISTLVPTRERDRLQLLRMIDYLSGVTERADVVPALIIVTPAGGTIKEEITEVASRGKVCLLHAQVEANSNNPRVIRVGPAQSLNRPVRGIALWNFLKHGRGLPAGLNL